MRTMNHNKKVFIGLRNSCPFKYHLNTEKFKKNFWLRKGDKFLVKFAF